MQLTNKEEKHKSCRKLKSVTCTRLIVTFLVKPSLTSTGKQIPHVHVDNYVVVFHVIAMQAASI